MTVQRKRMRRPSRGAALSMLLLSLVGMGSSLQAQGVTTGSIGGTVSDTAGMVLSAVAITVTDLRTDVRFEAVTDDAGRYLVPFLPPGGPYAVEAARLGYRPRVHRASVSLGDLAAVDLTLVPAAVDLPALSVDAGTDPAFSRTRTTTETLVGEADIARYPSIDRQVTDYLRLSPRVVSVRDGFAAAGKSFYYNSIRIDGALAHDLFGLTDDGIPGGAGNARALSVEAIEELQVVTASYDVRHAGFTGALINAVTKSGTNRWTGSAFGYHTRADFVNASPEDGSSDFTDTHVGFSLGGPLRAGRLFVFTNAEFQFTDAPAPGPYFRAGGPVSEGARDAGVHPDSALRFIDILEEMGFEDVGTPEEIELANPRTNLLARLDYVAGSDSRFVLRHSYGRMADDQAPARRPGLFSLSSAGLHQTSVVNSTVLQWVSRPGGRWHNDASLNLQFHRQEREARVPMPLVRVGLVSDLDGRPVPTTLAAGGEPVAQEANRLDQDIVQVADRLAGRFGSHELAFGVLGELFRFRDRFAPQTLGVFDFASLGALEMGAGSDYIVTALPADLDDAAVSWRLLTLGGYVQDTWAVTPRLTLTGGVRVDVPVFLDTPDANPAFEEAFGRGTDVRPGVRPRLQPRLGFNWNDGNAPRTQVRGGVGLFAGRPSFVWLSNAYRNTGTRFSVLRCPGDLAPVLDAADYPDTPPQACADGTSRTLPAPIDILDADFAFPLDLKASVGIDRRLAPALTLTADVLYSYAIDEPFFAEDNLVDEPVGFDAAQGGRPLFGSPFGTPAAGGFRPARKSPAFQQVVRLTSRSGAEALSATLGVEGRVDEWLRLRASYTWTDADDRQSQLSILGPQSFSSTPIRGNPNEPELAASAFARRHHVVLFATAEWALGGNAVLGVTPLYVGTSGAPYSYTVAGDANGDGYPFVLAPNRYNDLVYVPGGPSELAFATPEDGARFDDFIESEPCLRSQRGGLVRRNSCQAPWRHRWDLRVTLGLGTVRNLELVIDVINLFDQAVREPAGVEYGIGLLAITGRENGEAGGDLIYRYVGPASREALLQDRRPDSWRQVQLGLRVAF